MQKSLYRYIQKVANISGKSLIKTLRKDLKTTSAFYSDKMKTREPMSLISTLKLNSNSHCNYLHHFKFVDSFSRY